MGHLTSGMFILCELTDSAYHISKTLPVVFLSILLTLGVVGLKYDHGKEKRASKCQSIVGKYVQTVLCYKLK